jgi:hypothetical protein
MWSLLTWFWKHRRQGATMVLVTVAFLCLGSSLLLAFPYLYAHCFLSMSCVSSLFSSSSARGSFSLASSVSSQRNRGTKICSWLSSRLCIMSVQRGKGGGVTEDEVGAPVLAGQCASLFLSLQSSLSNQPPPPFFRCSSVYIEFGGW